MLYYNKIDISEGIDVNKTGASKEYIICHHWYLLDKGSTVCNGCHDALMMSIDIGSIAIYGVDYRCIEKQELRIYSKTMLI